MVEKINIEQAWHSFVEKWLVHAEQRGFPNIVHDEQWPSPCEFEVDDECFWRPSLQSDVDGHQASFENVEQALEVTLDAEYKKFFSLYFSEELAASHEKGPLYYLQAWSEADFERLQQNLIGHLLMKQRLKQAPTLFFAVTDEDDLNLVVINETGQVALEYVGQEPHEVLAESLSEFIQQTTPQFA
jgi:SecY interacting protein Syd